VFGELAVLAQHDVDAPIDAQERQRGGQPHGSVLDAAFAAQGAVDARDAQLGGHHLMHARFDEGVDDSGRAGVDVRE
jgi:hypothetical protein